MVARGVIYHLAGCRRNLRMTSGYVLSIFEVFQWHCAPPILSVNQFYIYPANLCRASKMISSKPFVTAQTDAAKWENRLAQCQILCSDVFLEVRKEIMGKAIAIELDLQLKPRKNFWRKNQIPTPRTFFIRTIFLRWNRIVYSINWSRPPRKPDAGIFSQPHHPFQRIDRISQITDTPSTTDSSHLQHPSNQNPRLELLIVPGCITQYLLAKNP